MSAAAVGLAARDHDDPRVHDAPAIRARDLHAENRTQPRLRAIGGAPAAWTMAQTHLIACLPAMGSLIKKRRKRMRKKKHKKLLKKTRWARRQQGK